jgi:L-threonylcarbamoyladenylate synthase
MEIIGVDPKSQDVPRRALETLRDGGLVAFPTETFYALGAVAADEVAVARVFAVKRRPPSDPVPVLVADRAQWRQLVAELPQSAVRLADRFWPGPLTIVCRIAPSLSRALAGGGETIGVRQPGLPIAAAICHTLGAPIVGTSANTHGLPSPVTAVQVALDLGADVDLILDGGRCPLARPSTVVDVTRTPPGVVRVGAVPLAAIREVLGEIAVPDGVR